MFYIKKILFDSSACSKVMAHISRLLSQSNTGVKIELCENLIIPALKEICCQGIESYLTRMNQEQEVLVGLIKCYRLTLTDSTDSRLTDFIQSYGSQLILACRKIPGVRHEAFALLCAAVCKELKMKPTLPDVDEENVMVFSKMFECEILEHDEFWSAYFGMKAEEVRQRFFIHKN